MPTARVNGIDLCYESFGDDEAPPLLLVMGFAAQMILWSPGFVSELLERGFRVIRFDNRDCGLSTKTEGNPPNVLALWAAGQAGQPIEAPYSLSDMADDAVGLLDHLGIEAAHVVGASMGGMIVQTMAIDHPERVLSLTSIMSTTGNPQDGEPDPHAIGALLAPPPPSREAVIEAGVNISKVLAGPLWDEARAREHATESYDRCFHPKGAGFQLAAIGKSGDRTEALGHLEVPSLVIHGREDPLITLSGGIATAEAIPGSDLIVYGQMGHDLPKLYWPQIADAITGIAGRSGAGHHHAH